MPTEKMVQDDMVVRAAQHFREELDADLFLGVYPLSFEKMLHGAGAAVRSGRISIGVLSDDTKPVPTSGPVADLERDWFPISLVDGQAIVQVSGPIFKGSNILTRLYGGSSTKTLQQILRLAAADEDVKRIVLSIDSPGGSVSGLSELGDTLDRVRARKPVVSHIDGLGASAAYYIASHTDTIYAERTALVGSIGTIMVMYDYAKMFEEAGVKPVVIATGPYKGTGVMGTEITEDQQTELREIVDFYFREFAATVMKGRSMAKKDFDELATGRVWDAPAARKMGLVDQLTTLDGVLAKGRSRSNRIKAEVGLAGING